MGARRAEVVAAARHCKGTRYSHQGRIPLVGLDCAGVVIYAGVSTGAAEPFDFKNYAPVPDPAVVRAQLDDNLDRTFEIKDGNVLLLNVHGLAIHLGILTENCSLLIHCHAHFPRRVVEESWDKSLWKARSIYRYRGIID